MLIELLVKEWKRDGVRWSLATRSFQAFQECDATLLGTLDLERGFPSIFLFKKLMYFLIFITRKPKFGQTFHGCSVRLLRRP